MSFCIGNKLCSCIFFTLISVGYLSFLFINLEDQKINENFRFIIYNIFAAVVILYNIVFLYVLIENLFLANSYKVMLIISSIINIGLGVFTIFEVVNSISKNYLLLIFNSVFQVLTFGAILYKYQFINKEPVKKSPSTEKLLA